MELKNSSFSEQAVAFIRGLLDSRGWLFLLLGSALFLSVQSFAMLEVLVSTLGFVFISVGVASMCRKMAFVKFDLASAINEAIEYKNIPAAIICVAVILFMAVVTWITAMFISV